MFSGILFAQSSIYRQKVVVEVNSEINTVAMQNNVNPIGTTVVTVNPAPQTQTQPETINLNGVIEKSTVTAITIDNNVNSSAATNDDSDISEYDVPHIEKYICSDMMFCFVFAVYGFAYTGFHDDVITVFAIIFFVIHLTYLVIICMKSWRTLFHKIVYVLSVLTSIGYISFLFFNVKKHSLISFK